MQIYETRIKTPDDVQVSEIECFCGEYLVSREDIRTLRFWKLNGKSWNELFQWRDTDQSFRCGIKLSYRGTFLVYHYWQPQIIILSGGPPIQRQTPERVIEVLSLPENDSRACWAVLCNESPGAILMILMDENGNDIASTTFSGNRSNIRCHASQLWLDFFSIEEYSLRTKVSCVGWRHSSRSFEDKQRQVLRFTHSYGCPLLFPVNSRLHRVLREREPIKNVWEIWDWNSQERRFEFTSTFQPPSELKLDCPLMASSHFFCSPGQVMLIESHPKPQPRYVLDKLQRAQKDDADPRIIWILPTTNKSKQLIRLSAREGTLAELSTTCFARSVVAAIPDGQILETFFLAMTQLQRNSIPSLTT